MALATKPPGSPQPAHSPRRIWQAPVSPARWLWLLIAALLSGVMIVLYSAARLTQPFPGPFTDPLRSFGIVAFLLVLGTAAYSLRRRFVRNLPGKTQSWLWMHIWLGCAALLIALLHENFEHIFSDYCQNTSCLTASYGGTSALIALGILVLSGIIGRLLDRWQAHTIAKNASSNGAGIIQALEERLLEVEYTLERLCAGKSEAFQAYCYQALEGSQASSTIPTLPPGEQADFQRSREVVLLYDRLRAALRQQRRACLLMRVWRSIHRIMAVLALLIILFHATMELLTSVFHIITPT